MIKKYWIGVYLISAIGGEGLTVQKLKKKKRNNQVKEKMDWLVSGNLLIEIFGYLFSFKVILRYSQFELNCVWDWDGLPLMKAR